MEITLSINKEDVMREVAVTTAYTGAKMDNDENALHRISTVDEDENHLERFWDESRADICQELIGLVTFEGMVNNSVRPDYPFNPVMPVEPLATTAELPIIQARQHYELRLDVSKSFDEALLPSMRLSLFNFFIQNIVAKWYIYTNKNEAGDYADKATTLLDDIHRKAVYKKKPTRPTYDD
ncbi:hypothetical protein [Muribaculum intestinale]|uniref:hypothetical protein n=1 Tax=Muribaculum intestinale TaxID=1796646 RepID=UPI0026F397B1|nr:hypothetical protein [Muribaculum intestinale]